MDKLEVLKQRLTGSLLLDGDAKNNRVIGLDWPQDAMTMIGDVRMENIRYCLEQSMHVDGHFIETGVWRGGACIFAKAIINALGSKKKVFVADSFCGLPKPNENFPGHTQCNFWNDAYLKVSRKEVEDNFKRYECLDDDVVFVEGWFNETLKKLDEKFCVIRLDGDLYESTMDALEALYPKLQVGGYVILDEYMKLEGCRAATEVFRWKNKISEKICVIDHSGAYWKKEK